MANHKSITIILFTSTHLYCLTFFTVSAICLLPSRPTGIMTIVTLFNRLQILLTKTALCFTNHLLPLTNFLTKYLIVCGDSSVPLVHHKAATLTHSNCISSTKYTGSDDKLTAQTITLVDVTTSVTGFQWKNW